MRKVKVSKMIFNKVNGKPEKIEIGIATFHQFGCAYEEFESGAGNYSTAIIEWEGGKVQNVDVEMIQFID